MADVTIRELGADRSTELDLDDGATFYFDWVESDWGTANQPEPDEEMSVEGAVTYLPLEQAWHRRNLRLAGFVEYSGHNAKLRGISDLAKIFQGRKTIRLKSFELDVFGMAPTEQGDSTRTPQVLGYEAQMYAQPPFWRLVFAFNAIAYGNLLYPDLGIPVGEAQPPYLFGRDLAGAQAIAANPGAGVAHFTIDNWGTAFCYAAASITGGPASTVLYLEGKGRNRVKLTTNASGAATLATTDRFYLAPGSQGIRFENAAGTAIDLTAQAAMRIDFGATVPRFR